MYPMSKIKTKYDLYDAIRDGDVDTLWAFRDECQRWERRELHRKKGFEYITASQEEDLRKGIITREEYDAAVEYAYTLMSTCHASEKSINFQVFMISQILKLPYYVETLMQAIILFDYIQKFNKPSTVKH